MHYFNLLFCLLPLFGSPQVVVGSLPGKNTEMVEEQISSFPVFEWEKVIIKDYLYDSFQNDFLIERSTNSITLLGELDSIIKKLDEKLVDEIISELKKELEKEFDTRTHVDPIIMFQRDSAWYLNNSSRLWESYKKSQNLKIKDQKDSIALKLINDYSLVKKVIWKMQGTQKPNFYPMLDLMIISSKDTIHIQATGQYPYMLPWYNFSNGYYVLNSQIAVLVSKLLPNDNNTNNNRLTDTFFEYSLMDEIYNTLLKGEINRTRKKRRNSKRR